MKLLIIGIDGASWDLVNTFLREGRLKTLNKIKEEGAFGLLNSMRPLISSVLWTTIATGKTPEKHGILGFTSTSKNVRTFRLWDILQKKGWRVGLFGYFTTWPPPKVNGFVIPHIFATGNETYPEHLSYIQDLILGARVGRNFGLRNYSSIGFKLLYKRYVSTYSLLKAANFFLWRVLNRKAQGGEIFWRKAVFGTFLQADIFLGLIREYKPDFAFFHIHLLDSLSHKYWKYMKPEDFEDVKKDDIERYGNVIPKAYEAVDETIGFILNRLKKVTNLDNLNLVILSDHGFTSVIEMGVKERQMYTIRAEELLKVSGLENIAYLVSVGTRIYCYLKRRNSNDKQKIIEVFSKSRFQSGRPLFSIEEEGDYLLIRPGFEELENLEREIIIAGKTVPFEYIFARLGVSYSGTHHPHGVIFMKGPVIKKGIKIQDASILDVTPTVLAMLGIEVAKDMDGRVLKEIFKEDFLRKSPIKYIETHDTGEIKWSEEEGEMDDFLKERLKGLGYM